MLNATTIVLRKSILQVRSVVIRWCNVLRKDQVIVIVILELMLLKTSPKPEKKSLFSKCGCITDEKQLQTQYNNTSFQLRL